MSNQQFRLRLQALQAQLDSIDDSEFERRRHDLEQELHAIRQEAEITFTPKSIAHEMELAITPPSNDLERRQLRKLRLLQSLWDIVDETTDPNAEGNTQ